MSKNVSGIISWLKDWFYDKGEVDNQSIEFVRGTHGTTATGAWTGKCSKLTELKEGTKIYFLMTSAGSGNASLNLTLADGSVTGAKDVYYNNSTRLTTHFPINTVLSLVFDGSKWITLQIQNTNNFERLYSTGQIINGESSQLNQGTIICGKSDKKYYKLASGVTFNVQYPIFWLGSNQASGAITNNVYSYYLYCNVQSTVSGKTVTSNSEVFIEGTKYTEGQFTVSTNVLVSDGQFTKGRYYIPVGQASTTTNIRFNNANSDTVYYYNHYGKLIQISEVNIVEVPNGSDLNNYTTQGFYYQGANANTSNMKNTPLTGTAFSLQVYPVGNNYVKQVWTAFNKTNPRTFIRTQHWDANSWGDWFEVAWNKDIPTKVSQLTNDKNFIDTAGTGLSKNGTTLNHSNSVSAQTSSVFKKIKYDAQGHITGTEDVTSSDLPSHTHTMADLSDLTVGFNKYSLKQTLTKNGCTVKVYANASNVYIKYSGTASLSANTNLEIGTITDPTLRPSEGYEYGLIGHVNANIYGAVNSSGTIYIINKTTSTSSAVAGSIQYPLKTYF